eukprot:GILK01004257.1.p1 GENE.GILK01004257.1~~GILK01004257.1.p1  ORF type:complete len:438 (-),score=18.21 GILK01004257.1:269-1582(-)
MYAHSPRVHTGAGLQPTPASPIPLPDMSAFDDQPELESKHASAQKYSTPLCPPSPLKSPAVSRLFKSVEYIVQTPHFPFTFSAHKTPASRPPSFEEDFVNLGPLGSGHFGDVFKVCSLVDNQIYAIKKSRRQFRGTRDRERALQEVHKLAVLCRFGDPGSDPLSAFCVRYYRAWEDKGYLYIQTELCERGSLMDYLDRQNEHLSEEQIWLFLCDIALALKYIHENNLVHLDVKPSNLFLTAAGSLKLGDFGLAVEVGTTGEVEGDSAYMAPELLKHIDGYGVGPMADVFSLGATTFELAAHVKMPSSGPLWHRLREGQVSLPDHPMRSAALSDLIRAMMHPQPHHRPSAQQILQHPTLQSILASRSITIQQSILTGTPRIHSSVSLVGTSSTRFSVIEEFLEEDVMETTRVEEPRARSRPHPYPKNLLEAFEHADML